MSAYEPQTHLRERPIDKGRPDSIAICFIDIQRYTCSRSSVLYASQPDGDFEYFFDRLERVCRKNWRLLVTKAREAHIHVFTCVIQSLRKDGKDRGLDYRLSGFQVQPGSVDARPFIPELAPRENEICLPKTSESHGSLFGMYHSFLRRDVYVCRLECVQQHKFELPAWEHGCRAADSVWMPHGPVHRSRS